MGATLGAAVRDAPNHLRSCPQMPLTDTQIKALKPTAKTRK
ncbi:protein of unknown function [Thauera humireducens]|nr:protein of unknown function [Thauera humireducens]